VSEASPTSAGVPPLQGHWTPEQRLGITTVGQSLLVSAAAGSGKTAMLAERCAYLVCDAPEPYRCDVDELLVVTFTEAAALQMKSRITKALRERAERDPNGRAAQQLKFVDAAHVSTLHSFCSRVLRQHFHLIGLDPAFALLDPEEAKLLRTEVARELFEDRYELDDSGVFQRFVDAYGDGDDERLVRLVIRARELLTSLVDPAGWIDHARKRIAEGGSRPLDESELGRELHALVERELANLADRCERAIAQIKKLKGFDKYMGVLNDARQTIRHWGRVFREAGLSALREESDVEFERLPSIPNSVPDKALAKAAIDSVREAMKAGTWRELLRFSPDEWADGLRAIVPYADVFLKLVADFARRYRNAKDTSRSLDFSDLERFTLRVLRDPSQPKVLAPSAAAHSFHRRFKHVLVDEYQDINEVQDAILTLVSRECVCDGHRQRANLFCVGDVKQSIYRFRLAEPRRFLDRRELFRADGGRRVGSVIDLQRNFRSRALLLEAINGVFVRLMTRETVDITYDDSHRLKPGANFPPPSDGECTFDGAPIELHLLPAKLDQSDAPSEREAEPDCDEPSDADLDRAEREAVLLTKRIREMMGLEGKPPMCVADGGATRPMRFRDVVILLRSMKYKADQYAEVLRQSGIPVHAESGSGYFESTEVNEILALLSLLNNARQDVPLAAVLRGPIARLLDPENSLAKIRIASPGGEGVAFHEAVTTYATTQSDELAAHLRAFVDQLSRWRELAQRRPLADVIERIFEQSGYLAWCAALPGGEQRVANLLYLIERARQFGTFHRQGLARFLEFIENLKEESDLGQPSVASDAEDVVRIMSVHRSKGLEFPVVVLPDLGKSINLDDCHGTILLDRITGLGMSVADERKCVRYPSLASTLVKARLTQQALAEEMRVLYVAMTRAKEHLVLVGTAGAEAEEQWRARWAGHTGVLPGEVVLGTSNMLGWLGPVASAAGLTDETIRVTAHRAEEVAAWRTQAKRRVTLTPEQEKLARLEPLDSPPVRSAAAEDLIARMTATYPHEPFARLNAAEAMSERDTTMVGSLAKPGFMLEARALAAVDVGEATHLVLQHLDFRRPCDEADVKAQLSDLVERKLIAAAQAQAVDVESLVWLVKSPAGELLRTHANQVRRELPVYLARPAAGASSTDPQDQVMYRGRIDALIPLPDGSIVIDYKTDRISCEDLAARAEAYESQMTGYRETVQAITGTPVREVILVFLHPRKIARLT
jgi:ATP-dependent helicase/nuclease subunit A